MDSKQWLLDEYLFAKEELEPDIQCYTNRLFWLHRPVLHVPQGVFQPEFMMLSSNKDDSYFRVYTLMGIDRPRQAVELDCNYFSHSMICPRKGGEYWHFRVCTLTGIDRPRQVVELDSNYSYHHMVCPRKGGYWPQDMGCDKELSLLSPDTEAWSSPAADHLNTMLKDGVILAWLEKPAFRVPEFHFDFMVIGRDGKMAFYLQTNKKPNQNTFASFHWLKSLYPNFDFCVSTLTCGKWYEAYVPPISNISKELETAAKQLGMEGKA